MRALTALALLAVCFPAYLHAATDSTETATTGHDGEPSAEPTLVPSLSLQGLLPPEVIYHKILAFPDNPYMMMVLASWNGFQLRITDEEMIRSSWDLEDKESRGCFVSCVNIRSGSLQFCSNNTRVVSFGVGNVAAKCQPGDMVFRKSTTTLAQHMLYVSGSLSGSTEYIDVQKGAVRSSCLGMCGFVSSIKVGQSLIKSIDGLDLLISKDDADPAMSHIDSISPGPSDGFWVGGIVEKGSGSFQTGPGFELSSNTDEMSPRGFIGYFSYGGTSHLKLIWAQQLGDDRLSNKSPAIGAISDSTSCSAVVAGAWEGGSQIFEAPEAVNSVAAPEVLYNATDALEEPSSVAAVVITLPGGCAPSEGAASASVHGITTGGDVVAVSAGQAGVNANVYVAVEGGEDDGTPVVFEATLLEDGGNGTMIWEEGSSTLDLSVPDLEGIAGLVYDSKSDNLFLYMQRENLVCSFGVFSLGNEETAWRDAYGPGCGCTAGKMGLEIVKFKMYLTDKDSTNQMADISAHGQNKVLFFGLTGNLASPEYCATPGVTGNKFPVSDFASAYYDGNLTAKKLTDKNALDILDMVSRKVAEGTLGATNGADDINDVLKNSRPSSVILAASIKAMTTILYEALTPGSDVELTKNLMDSILVIVGHVATSPMASAPVRNNAVALADRIFVGIAKQLVPGEVFPLDTIPVQAVVARSTPDRVINQLVTESRTAGWRIPEDLHNRDVLLILEHWSKTVDDGSPVIYASKAEKPIEDLTNDIVMRVLDPVTLETITKAPSDTSLAMYDIRREDLRRKDDRLRVADCMWKEDTSEFAPWRSNGCVRKPGLLPRGTNVVWNTNFRLPEQRPAPEPIWFITSLDPSVDLKCNTTVLWPSALAERDAELGLVFDDVDFEGPGCWWKIPDPFGEWPMPEKRGQSCRWDVVSQTFVGPDCVIAPNANLGCMCRQWPMVSKVSMLPLPESIYISDTTYPEAPSRGDPFPIEYCWLTFAGFIIFMCVMMLLIFLFNRYRKTRLLARLLQPRYGFQGYMEKEGKAKQSYSRNHNPMKGFKLNNFREMTWRWSLDTYDFEMIADDLDTFSSLSGWEKHHFEAFRSSASQLLSVIGMPCGRAVVALPRAESLHWMPNNIIGTSDIDGWRNQALGTSMVMAYFIKHDILPKDILEQQLKRQELYFSGCHPIGFKALINRWRVMMVSDNVGGWEPWFDQAHSWRLTWLQRHDGLWDPCSCFLKALGADPDPLIAKIHCIEFPPGMQILVSQMPTPVVDLFRDNKHLGLRVWCTCLAKAYLEHCEFLWSDFTGREAEGQEPILMTLIAKEAIDYHIRSRVTEEWLKKVNVESLGHLIANMEENAKQVVSSFSNTRELRLKAWIMDDLAYIQQTDVMKMEKMTTLDKVTCVQHLRNEHKKFILSRMIRNGQEIDPPTEWMKYTNVLRGSVKKLISKIFHMHKTLRIFCSSITDCFSLFDRVLVAWTIVVTLLGCNTWIVFSRSGECCNSIREDLDCALDNSKTPTTEYCTRHIVQSYTTPARIQYTQNETQHIDADTSCSWLMNNFKPEGWKCDAFPNPHSIVEIILAGLICNAIVFPFKILLRFLFTYKHQSHTSLWDKLNWIEFIWDNVPIKALKRNATGWNVREAKTALQWSKILPVEDHFALDNTTITDLVVSDKVTASVTPVKAKQQTPKASKARSKASNLTETDESSSRSIVPDQMPAPPEEEEEVQPLEGEVHVGALVMRPPSRGFVRSRSRNSSFEIVRSRRRRSSSVGYGAHPVAVSTSLGEDVAPPRIGQFLSTSQVPSSVAYPEDISVGRRRSASQVPSFLVGQRSVDHT